MSGEFTRRSQPKIDCPVCKGTRYDAVFDPYGSGYKRRYIYCGTCHGAGTLTRESFISWLILHEKRQRGSS